MKRLVLFIALFGLGGCGYHVGGRGDLVPKNVKTIAVEPFRNITVRYDLARMLPEDISREFVERTRYRVVADENAADAVLRGAVLTFVFYPTTSDPVTGRATAAQVIVNLQVSLTDRVTGKVIFSRPSMEIRERYEISEDVQKYFDESGTAMIRVSRDAARSVVSAILENF